MDREHLSHLPIIRAVAECGGFAVAAARLGMSPSAVSHAVRMVEDRLGLPLFARTTRSVSLTEAGASFLATIGPALTAIDEAGDRVRAAKAGVTGLLRLNLPRLALHVGLTPVLAKMSARHPNLTIELTVDDRLIDIVAAGFDAGIRLGEMIEQDMIAVRLTPPFNAILVAAPAYLQARGEPRSIADLANHNCVAFRLPTGGGLYTWNLRDKSQGDLSVRVRGTIITSDPLYSVDLALAGVGIAYVFESLVRPHLRDGRLRPLLPEAGSDQPGLFLYFPRRASEAPKLRAFIEAARSVLSAAQPPDTRRKRLPSRRLIAKD
jgi:DNA-binding transcriptional LysR family regulator